MVTLEAQSKNPIKEKRVLLGGNIITKLEKAIKGVDQQISGNNSKPSNPLVPHTYIIVTTAIGEDGKEIKNLNGKKLLITGEHLPQLSDYQGKQVDLIGITKKEKSIDVSFTVDELVTDYLTLTLCLLNERELRTEKLNNARLSLLTKYDLSHANRFVDASFDQSFEVVLISDYVQNKGKKEIKGSLALKFDSIWADPLPKFIDNRGDFPLISFRNGGANIEMSNVGDNNIIDAITKSHTNNLVHVDENTEVQISNIAYIFKQGKCCRKN